MKQHHKLTLIIILIICLGTIASLIVKEVWFIRSNEIYYIGISAPFEGLESGIGTSIERGVSVLVDEVNSNKEVKEHDLRLEIKKSDTKNSNDGAANSANELVNTEKMVSVVGYMGSEAIESVSKIYENANIPLINISSTESPPDKLNKYPNIYATVTDSNSETGFIANYTRNVLGNKIVTIIHSDSPHGKKMADAFTSVYARFGTQIHYTYSFNPNNLPASIDDIVVQIKDLKDLGTIFFAGDAPSAANFVVKARDASIKNLIVGTNVVATTGFREAIAEFVKDKDKVAAYTDGIVMSSPLLYDTAGGEAQQFKNQYMEKFGTAPDWIAAYAYDAAKMMFKAILRDETEDKPSPKTCSAAIIRYFNSLITPESANNGVTGQTWFSTTGKHQKPVQVGIYNGRNIIAAPTQLQPIKSNSSVNYFEEIKSGRVLYVNDRFMYKTNVIYTGIEVHEITDVNIQNYNAVIDCSIWFRYRGKFNPADVDFLNGVHDVKNDIQEIKLSEPIESSEQKDISFRLYRIKGRFNLNFLDTKLEYGKHLMGLSFNHKNLNRNNVIYVVDMLGMGFDKQMTLRGQLNARRALNPAFGWRIDDAWLSQIIFTTSSFGSPMYVGYGAADPDFSRIDYGVIFSENRLNFRTLIPSEYLIYIGIFGIVGSIVAWFIDRQLKGIFWLTSSWFIRVFFWPLLILSIGNLSVNSAIRHNVSVHYIQDLIMGYDMLWWLVPATLLVVALERFLWNPLENRTKRKIPNVIRKFVAATIYLFAFFGIVAFVLDQKLTSLLATSGLFTMIVGLAIQGNIANVFTGIVINIERPFSIGDWIKINDIDSVNVVDMTWRTVRLQTLTNHMISIPNGQVGDSVVVNYSKDSIRIDIPIQISTQYEPDKILKLLKEIIESVPEASSVKPPAHAFLGAKALSNSWVAEYVMRVWVSNWKNQFALRGKLWNAVWKRFTAEGISLNPVEENEPTALLHSPTIQMLAKKAENSNKIEDSVNATGANSPSLLQKTTPTPQNI
ncbi:MAG: ABC transporter substrate-binding protein [Desulfamplus sp.]|nr:ABC transporter substrate-binding protein [Desulfamplus sp.]